MTQYGTPPLHILRSLAPVGNFLPSPVWPQQRMRGTMPLAFADEQRNQALTCHLSWYGAGGPRYPEQSCALQPYWVFTYYPESQPQMA